MRLPELYLGTRYHAMRTRRFSKDPLVHIVPVEGRHTRADGRGGKYAVCHAAVYVTVSECDDLRVCPVCLKTANVRSAKHPGDSR